MQGIKVLIIDDDEKLRVLMEHSFITAGAEAKTAIDGKVGLREFYEFKPDLVILDVLMPNMDGWETCKSIRLLSDVPIIMLTALGQDKDIVKGLDAGADDYMIKPFSVKVLVARAKAAVRRANTPVTTKKAIIYSDGHLTINLDEYSVLISAEHIKLTATEFRLLAYMLENAGRVVSFKQILENVWGWEYVDDLSYSRVYIWHLRQKIEPDPKNPIYLINVQGIGYRFEKQK